ncbi:MAG: hypothetical protein IJI41_11715 [Anaerolineaceae bacterium]|nr:hypothetical protein [Anaerolineaceae bacterium]
MLTTIFQYINGLLADHCSTGTSVICLLTTIPQYTGGLLADHCTPDTQLSQVCFKRERVSYNVLHYRRFV